MVKVWPYLISMFMMLRSCEAAISPKLFRSRFNKWKALFCIINRFFEVKTLVLYDNNNDNLLTICWQSTGFFRGLSWPVLSAGVINSVYFGVYGYTLKLLGGDTKESSTPPYLSIFIAGCAGGVVQLIPACPADVIKVVLQSQIPHGTGNNGGQYTEHVR